jgi:hypothetical protein
MSETTKSNYRRMEESITLAPLEEQVASQRDGGRLASVIDSSIRR